MERRGARIGDGRAITVLVVDDDLATRTLLTTVLGLAGYRTIHAERGEDVLDLVRRGSPSLVLLEVHLPGISGYEVCRELREEFGDQLPIMFVSGERVESFDRTAGLLIGADDYLVKPLDPDELLARARALLRRAACARASPVMLTGREFEVLRLLAEGLAQAEIAERLVISRKTVATHIERILAKLGVHSRVQAVALAYSWGLIRVDR